MVAFDWSYKAGLLATVAFNAGRWALGFVGGMIGLLSLTMPWVTMGFEVSGQPVVPPIGVSPLDVYNWYSKAEQAGVEFPSGSDGTNFQDVLSNRFAIGILFMVVGGLILVISSIVSLGAAQAGYGMFAGSIMALIGSLMMLTNVTYFGMTAYISPGAGVFIAVVASLVSVAGSRIKHEAKPTERPQPVYVLAGSDGTYVPVLTSMPLVSTGVRTSAQKPSLVQANLQAYSIVPTAQPMTSSQRSVHYVPHSRPKERSKYVWAKVACYWLGGSLLGLTLIFFVSLAAPLLIVGVGLIIVGYKADDWMPRIVTLARGGIRAIKTGISRPSWIRRNAIPEMLFCQTCGRRYGEGKKVCSRDGTVLKAMIKEAIKLSGVQAMDPGSEH